MASEPVTRPWSLVSDHQDTDMQAIRHAIDAPVVVGDAGQLLDRLKARRQPVAILDLVGHSHDVACFLALGTWVLDDSPTTAIVFSGQLAPEIKRLGISKVRLLGCSTALTPRGWSVIKSIDNTLDPAVEVFGTPRPIDANDFEHGYYNGDLQGSDTWSGPGPGAHAVATVFPDTARVHVPLAFAQRQSALPDPLGGLVDLIEPDSAWVRPGLLAAPLAEVSLPSGSPGGPHRLQALLGYEVVRVFSEPDPTRGILYRVRDPSALAGLVAHLKPSS